MPDPRKRRGGSKSSSAVSQSYLITDIGPQGDGIAHHGTAPVYIERALPDDEVSTRIVKGKDGVLRGSVDQIHKASPFRVRPDCRLYDQCGGCSMQHANEFFYKGFKQDIVHRALKRVGLKPVYLDPVFGAPRTRRRATFAVYADSRGNIVTGYYKRRTHEITPVPDCLVVQPELIAWRDRITPYLKNIIRGRTPTDMFLQLVDGQVEIVFTGPVGAKNIPDLGVWETAGALVRDLGVARIGWHAKPFDPIEMLIDDKPLRARFGDLSVSLPVNAFMQPTQEGQEALVQCVLNTLPAEKMGRIVDLFSGCGTFTGPLLQRAHHVDAFDISGVDMLARAATGHKLTAVRRDLFEKPLTRDELKKYDAIVFDPPRAGCMEQAREIARCPVKLAIGVSCNPATFARDARILCDGGFKLETVQIVDQFVWSHHVELVGKFVR